MLRPFRSAPPRKPAPLADGRDESVRGGRKMRPNALKRLDRRKSVISDPNEINGLRATREAVRLPKRQFRPAGRKKSASGGKDLFPGAVTLNVGAAPHPALRATFSPPCGEKGSASFGVFMALRRKADSRVGFCQQKPCQPKAASDRRCHREATGAKRRSAVGA